MSRPVILIIFVFFSILFTNAHAQKPVGRISGIVVSDSTRQKIMSATVTLMILQDSTVEKMVVSDNNGRFSFLGLKPVSYRIVITEINHIPLVRDVSLSEEKMEIHLDSLVMKYATNFLDMVTIVSQVPILFKKDTVEFNASSFKIKEQDMVEDLLKKLPGVEVARDGSVTAQGEKITKILVDGKPFFGDDPKMATQNLPANIIDKVQVIDEKSERTRVTKVEDGQREKVINITTKKDKRKGSFGRGYAGFGTNDRYEGQVNVNHFNGALRMAVIAGSTNTGRTDNTSGGTQSGSNFNGVSQDHTGRATFSNTWKDRLSLSANLAVNDNNNYTLQFKKRQTILGDSINYFEEENQVKRNRSGINGGIQLEYKPDSLTRLQLNQSVNYYSNSTQTILDFNSAAAPDRKINEGFRVNTNSSTAPLFNGNIIFSRLFRKSKRAVVLNISNNNSHTLSDGINLARNNFFPLNGSAYEQIINQLSDYETNTRSLQSSLMLHQPLGKKISLGLNLGYQKSRNNSNREIVDFNYVSQLYDRLNDSLSNRFSNSTTRKSAGIEMNYRLKHGHIILGAHYQHGKTTSVSHRNDSINLQAFSGLVPKISYNFYKRGKSVSSFSIHYNLENIAPQPVQLQPVIDVSNPLYLRYGNPSLRFSTIHRIGFYYNRNHPRTGSSLNSGGSLNSIVNSITTSNTFDKATGIQTSRPVNVNGVYNGTGHLYVNTPFNLFKSKFRWFTNFHLNLSRNKTMINNEQNTSDALGYQISSGVSSDIGEILSFSLGFSTNTSIVRYSLLKEQDNRTGVKSMDTYIRLTPGKKNEFSVVWDYVLNTGRASGYNQNANMVSAEYIRYFGNKKDVWLKFRVYDLLKQNINVFRNSGENYFEDVQTNILARYFFVSLHVKLNKFRSSKK